MGRVRKLIGRVLRHYMTDAEFRTGASLVLNSHAGVGVTEELAMRTAAVQACVRLLSETISSLPLFLYERVDNGGKRPATEQSAFGVMHDRPNPRMTSMVFREVLQAVVSLWGNGYARIDKDDRGQARALYPLPAGMWRPKRITADEEVIYEGEDFNGERYEIPGREMLHIPGLGFDGIQGKSVIGWAREQIGSSIATDRFAASFFGNNGLPSGVLTSESTLTPDEAKLLQEQWEAARKDKPLGSAVLSGGLKWQQITIPPEDAQFLETRKFQVSEIARIFRVPPHLIGDLERATFSNIEQQSLEFVIFTLRPWLVRWEQEMNRKLLNGADRRQFFFEFKVDGLLRGDIKSRYDAYSVGRQWGWLSANDIRRLENMDPIDNGDQYLVPMNMTDSADAMKSDESRKLRAV